MIAMLKTEKYLLKLKSPRIYSVPYKAFFILSSV